MSSPTLQVKPSTQTQLLDKDPPPQSLPLPPSHLISSGCHKPPTPGPLLTPLTHLPWLFLLTLTFDFPLGPVALGGARVALSGCREAFLASFTLASWSLVWPPFLGAFSLAAPGLGGAVLTSSGFLGPLFTSPGLGGSCFASLGFLGTFSLASLGFLGAVMVDVFLGWTFLLCLGTNWWRIEWDRIESRSSQGLTPLHPTRAQRGRPPSKRGGGRRRWSTARGADAGPPLKCLIPKTHSIPVLLLKGGVLPLRSWGT